MKGTQYKNSNDSVQNSFQFESNINLAVNSTANTSVPININEIILTLTVFAHVKIGIGDATVSDMILPPGLWPLLINSEDTISVLKLTGSIDGQASIIIPKK
jgi:hypothetical protein